MTKRVSAGALSVVKEETVKDEEVRMRLNMVMRAHHPSHHLHHPEKSLVTPEPSVGERLSMSFGSASSGSGLDDEGKRAVQDDIMTGNESLIFASHDIIEPRAKVTR